MDRAAYEHMTSHLRQRPAAARAVEGANKGITAAIYVAYPCLLVWLFLTDNPLLLRAILVPGISFCLVSGLRVLINRPRPYEVFGLAPVVAKETRGKSFPSRHAFSIFVIATTFAFCTPLTALVVVLFVLAVALSAARVLAGVHFPSDVLAGAIIGIACGLVGFLL